MVEKSGDDAGGGGRERVAVVTGGGGAIGCAICLALAATGSHVVVADIAADAAENAAEQVRQFGGRALAVQVDLGDAEEVEQLTRTSLEEFGGVDVLVNNAAAVNLNQRDHALLDVDVEVWEHQLRVNVTAPMLLARGLVPSMLERGGGAIVNISSAAGSRGQSGGTGYGTTKAALEGLTRNIAVQYGREGVRCNAVAPGYVPNPNVVHLVPKTMEQVARAHHMTADLGRPEDIAAVVAFLASDAARFVTGAVVPVDGGLTAHLPLDGGHRLMASLETAHKR